MRRVMMTAAALFIGCTGGTETRTYELQHIAPDEAMTMLEPYVPGGPQNMRMTRQPASLTITAPTVRLDQVEEVLGTYDRARSVQLRFQIIEADGFTETDPAIADVQAVLQDLFRFRGYRLVAEVFAQARAPGHVQQRVALGEQRLYTIEAALERVSVSSTGKAVELGVQLQFFNSTVIATSLTVPSGQTVVVGSGRAQPDGNMLILVVRPVVQ